MEQPHLANIFGELQFALIMGFVYCAFALAACIVLLICNHKSTKRATVIKIICNVVVLVAILALFIHAIQVKADLPMTPEPTNLFRFYSFTYATEIQAQFFMPIICLMVILILNIISLIASRKKTAPTTPQKSSQ